MNDLIGTKYMRLCQWDKAIEWLTRVPISYINERGYAVYAAHRRWNVEPWIKRQWLREGMEYSGEKQHLKANPKILFAREVQQMEGELSVLSGKARQQRCYDLAVRYAQANFAGDCWFLMQDAKSVYDTLQVNEIDLQAKALNYLREAAKSSDLQLKEKALFAMTYCYLYEKPWEGTWYVSEWNDQKNEYERKPIRTSPQYKAFTALVDFERSNAQSTSSYVSRCDEYIQFCKQYKQLD